VTASLFSSSAVPGSGPCREYKPGRSCACRIRRSIFEKEGFILLEKKKSTRSQFSFKKSNKYNSHSIKSKRGQSVQSTQYHISSASHQGGDIIKQSCTASKQQALQHQRQAAAARGPPQASQPPAQGQAKQQFSRQDQPASHYCNRQSHKQSNQSTSPRDGKSATRRRMKARHDSQIGKWRCALACRGSSSRQFSGSSMPRPRQKESERKGKAGHVRDGSETQRPCNPKVPKEPGGAPEKCSERRFANPNKRHPVKFCRIRAEVFTPHTIQHTPQQQQHHSRTHHSTTHISESSRIAPPRRSGRRR